MRIRTSFPHETTHEDIRIPLAGGTSHACGSEEEHTSTRACGAR